MRRFVAGAQVMDGERVLGPVVSVAAAGHGTWRWPCCHWIRRRRTRIDGNAVRPLALLDGLAR